MTNGPPLAICSPIGFPDISKNLAFVKAVTFKFSPLDNKIKVESLTLLCLLFPISISSFMIGIYLPLAVTAICKKQKFM